MKRRVLVDIISTMVTALLAVITVLVGSLLVRVTWECLLLGWTGFGYWP
jgi:hypothetical protein